jgi:hypothetical protein
MWAAGDFRMFIATDLRSLQQGPSPPLLYTADKLINILLIFF